MDYVALRFYFGNITKIKAIKFCMCENVKLYVLLLLLVVVVLIRATSSNLSQYKNKNDKQTSIIQWALK